MRTIEDHLEAVQEPATHRSKSPLSLHSMGGNTYITSLRVTKLESIWPK